MMGIIGPVDEVSQRYGVHPSQIPGMDSNKLREHFLVESLFVDDQIKAVYSHLDRVVVAGISPVKESLVLGGFDEIRSDVFFDRREAGIVNVGGDGQVHLRSSEGEEVFDMERGGCLYIGRGQHVADFVSKGFAEPAKFYVFSAPAHATYPSAYVAPGQGNKLELGEQVTSNRRTLNQYIYDGGAKSCQVVMGVTELHEGSMWNTMPAHTHDRRMEAYLYFDVPEDQRVVHLMGEPRETRHLIVSNEQVVLSPPWSLHSGVGTASYSFVWAMAGENQAFDDMDAVPITMMQ